MMFVDSIAEIFSPLLQRVPIVILPKSLLMDVAQLTHVLAMKHITRIVLVPSLFRMMVVQVLDFQLTTYG